MKFGLSMTCAVPRALPAGNSRNMVANEVGIMPPPNKPWIARNTTIEPRLQEPAQAALARVKPSAEMT